MIINKIEEHFEDGKLASLDFYLTLDELDNREVMIEVGSELSKIDLLDDIDEDKIRKQALTDVEAKVAEDIIKIQEFENRTVEKTKEVKKGDIKKYK